ncbi:MAG: ABC transporter ATP-binding protein [Planctomycetota bacterium]
MTALDAQPATAAKPSQAQSMVRVHNLHKTYRMGRVRVPVLRGVDLHVDRGEWVAVLGSSGSGKSTLLHLIGGLDQADSADGTKLVVQDQDIARKSTRALNSYRTDTVGLIFQFYHLLPELSVVENVLLGAMIRLGRFRFWTKRGPLRERATELLSEFGLGHRLKHRPSELSGGERQRVAIARALINHPPLLLADEPTGNLDRDTGRSIVDAIEATRDRLQQTIVMVTHDREVAARADRIVRLTDGRVVDETPGSANEPKPN